MNLHLHAIFAAVCDAGSVTAAAEKLRMTQPAVSHAIKRLEKETGLALFDRLSKRLFITEQGKTYLAKTRNLLELCADMERGADEIAARRAIRIGSCITIACWWLPAILARFTREGGIPRVQVNAAEPMLRMLERNLVDLALYEGPDPGGPYVSRPFSRYRVVPVCSRAHRFAGKRNVPLAAFLREPLLLREPGSALRDVFDSFLRVRGITVEPFMTSINTQALIQSVKQNLGVALLAEPAALEERKRGTVAIVKIPDLRLENENSILFHVDKRQTDAMRHFIGCVTGGTEE